MKNIKALEQWLTRAVMEEKPFAVEVRDAIRAKGAADVKRAIATAQPPGFHGRYSDWPGSQKILEAADDADHAARSALPWESVPPGQDWDMDTSHFDDAFKHWQELRDKK